MKFKRNLDGRKMLMVGLVSALAYGLFGNVGLIAAAIWVVCIS